MTRASPLRILKEYKDRKTEHLSNPTVQGATKLETQTLKVVTVSQSTGFHAKESAKGEEKTVRPLFFSLVFFHVIFDRQKKEYL